jgi:hypothetical protein
MRRNMSTQPERHLTSDSGVMAFRAPAQPALAKSCPLCGGTAHVSEGTLEAHIALLSCARCRIFVIEKQLVDVIMNARAWNLLPVLRYVELLSWAAQSAASQGAVLLITSTNWIRVAINQHRLQETHLRPVDCGYVVPENRFQTAAAFSLERRG